MLLGEYRPRVQRGFDKMQSGGVVFFTIPSFIQGGLKTAFTSRIGGVSKGYYASLNFSMKREGKEENIRENFRRAARAAGVSCEEIVIDNYAHGCGVYHAGPQDAGKGLFKKTDLPECDALLIDGPGITAVTLHADCVPLFFLDPVRKVACVAHAGWRGVLGGLPEKIIATMTAEYQSETKDIHAAIGPHICTSCYEVGGELAEKFEEKFSDGVIMNKGSKIYLDLEAAILKQFMDADILPTNVTCADLCTYCHPELFYSHRRDHGKTGAMASLIAFEKAGENK